MINLIDTLLTKATNEGNLALANELYIRGGIHYFLNGEQPIPAAWGRLKQSLIAIALDSHLQPQNIDQTLSAIPRFSHGVSERRRKSSHFGVFTSK